MTASLRKPLQQPRPARRPQDADLEAVLAAWHAATERLEKTHLALRGEVRALTEELENKNRELARKNRLADLGQMASHVAHEVRNTLLPTTLYMSLLRRRLSDAESLEILDKIETGLMELDVTVNDLLHFTARRDPQWSTFNLHRLIDDVVKSLFPQLAAQGITPHVDVPRGQMAHADCDMLRRGLLNLILNAVDAMPEGGDLVITSCASPRGLEIEVADSGEGLSDSVRAKLFEPFFTTKSGGTGLGLAIVYRIAQAHGGDVAAVNCPEGGAAFTIRIPYRVQEAAA